MLLTVNQWLFPVIGQTPPELASMMFPMQLHRMTEQLEHVSISQDTSICHAAPLLCRSQTTYWTANETTVQFK